jgi:hypothetical protein
MPQSAPSTVNVSGNKELVPLVYNMTSQFPSFNTGNKWAVFIVPDPEWDSQIRRHNLDKNIYTSAGSQPLMAYSDLGSRVTYVKETGVRTLHPESLEKILAHEYGHLSLNTTDENKANKYVSDWLKQKARNAKQKK